MRSRSRGARRARAGDRRFDARQRVGAHAVGAPFSTFETVLTETGFPAPRA
jgi:hypothetical protein